MGRLEIISQGLNSGYLDHSKEPKKIDTQRHQFEKRVVEAFNTTARKEKVFEDYRTGKRAELKEPEEENDRHWEEATCANLDLLAAEQTIRKLRREVAKLAEKVAELQKEAEGVKAPKLSGFV